MALKKDNSAEEVSILSSGIKIEGKLYSEGNVRLDGKMVGELTVNGNLTLGDSSEVNGNIKSKNITISGNVEGTIHASEKVVLDTQARFKGDLFAKVLVIEEGAKFDGTSTMNQTAAQAAQRVTE
ncbi:MAG: cell shape determination protein CcmA [Ignavibacteriae bacterium HGW-Ignavibacteriae-2]|jgi:cytoskeletal protein CcmA (bactofilin family)|nr:polymer-forming cytoskeletal protein [Bacteroidota bacterium]PKL88125.1 MAG: cell shape determination protein CcmA [Ignavibacteriae bacterium HGW-Ignavibacteriae-2]